MNNYDRIKAMSIEEMAIMLADEIPHGDCDDCTLINDCCVQIGDKFENCCQNAFYKWLKKRIRRAK